MKRIELGKFLVSDSRVCHGQLTFKGTRVPVQTVLRRIAKGKSVESILEDWPELSGEAVEEAVALAAEALAERCANGIGIGR